MSRVEILKCDGCGEAIGGAVEMGISEIIEALEGICCVECGAPPKRDRAVSSTSQEQGQA